MKDKEEPGLIARGTGIESGEAPSCIKGGKALRPKKGGKVVYDTKSFGETGGSAMPSVKLEAVAC